MNGRSRANDIINLSSRIRFSVAAAELEPF